MRRRQQQDPPLRLITAADWYRYTLLVLSCRQLRRVNLEEVQQASDVAVLALSHACPDLEALDLSRTNLLFKITDVAFLALGERCPLLQVRRRRLLA